MKRAFIILAAILTGGFQELASQECFITRNSKIESMQLRYGPYLGEVPPDTVPRMFAYDFLSAVTEIFFSCTFSPDGNEFYFSGEKGLSDNIWFTEIANNEWTYPIMAPFIQTAYTIEPNFSPDGKRLYFVSDMTSYPPEGSIGYLRIWYRDRLTQGWSDPYLLQGPFPSTTVMFPTVASNGNLYFTGDIDGDHVGIFKSAYIDGVYQVPVLLDSAINKFPRQSHPFIAPDESYLIFDASPDGPPSWSNYLYISFMKQDANWSDAVRLPPSVNSKDKQFCGYVSPDQKYLFFNGSGPNGKTVLWWVKTDNIFHPLGIDDSMGEQAKSELYQNYPNPAGETTTVKIKITKKDHIELRLFDLLGREETTLIDAPMEPGTFSIRIQTAILKPGIYSYSLFSNKSVITKKMVVIK
jgi:hypothetical protein